MRKTAAFTALIAAVTVGILATRAETRPAPEHPALDDAAIVAIFDLANKADIETGLLATKRATSKEIRDFGRMLSDVHTAVRQQGGELAKKLAVVPVLPKGDQSAEQHAAVMARLGKLSGAEFDRAFLQHEQAFHAAVIAAITSTLLPAIQNQELKKFVASLAPAFEAHRLAAENLEKKLSSRE
jgi:putative membrane protein